MNTIKDIKKQIQSYRWDLFEKIPNCPLWIVQSALIAYAYMLNKMYKTGIFRGIWVFKNNDIFMYHLDDELEIAGKKILAQDIKKPGFIKNILDEIRSLSQKLMVESRRLQRLDVNKIANGKLAKMYFKLYEIHDHLWFRGQAINLLEMGRSLLGDKLKKILEGNSVSRSSLGEIFTVITTPEQYSFLQKEEQDLLGLIEGRPPGKKIKQHWQKYAWLGYNWQGPAYDVGYFEERVKLIRKEKNSKKYIKPETKYRQEIRRRKKEMVKKYKLSKEATRIAKLLEEIATMKALRVDASWLLYWSLEPLLCKIAREHFLSLTQVQFLKPLEMIKTLKGASVNANLLSQRKKMFALYFHDGIIDEYQGQIAQHLFDWLLAQTSVIERNIKELKGATGSPGKARGLVKIVDTVQDITKMEKGDVLVAHTTNPRLVTAMKLASAIIAEVGGVTSHAAIIARELGKPCIIGTKIATRVFQDGDEVEVDANRGVVKLVKKR
ncbi:MAG: pyruvate, water dikinase [Parcubacteria group bacterium Gr01-1014_31]|nr:MAG: pyruvate, water dikinase [Parcubacteria group bacterium Gr01-1014_31]